MSRRSQKESDIVETAATVAVGAAAAYGVYKLFQSISKSPQQDAFVEQSSANQHHRDSAPSFGATVSNVIGNMQLAHSGFKLCETLLGALPQEEPQRTQSTHSSQPIQSARYPDPYQSDRASIPSRPCISGADVVEKVQALYGGYKLCQSLFGSDSSNSNASREPIFKAAAVIETEIQAEEALKKLKEYVDLPFFINIST